MGNTLAIKATPGLQAIFPDAPIVNGNIHLAHEPRITIPLRAMGISVPPAIRSQYDWCGGSPFGIQVRSCELLTENPRGYLLNTMGTGKTRCVLWSFDYLRKIGHAGKLLVVCPISTMSFTWGHEIMKATPHLRWTVLHGTAAKRRERLADKNVDVYIINHDGLKIVVDEIIARRDIDVICLDELAVYRNRTHRTKIAKKLADAKTVVWGLTGSPMPNAVTDIYEQMRIVTPWRVPKAFTHFRDELMYRISQFKWVNKPNAIARAFEYLQPSLRYTLDDITELPEAYVPPPITTPLGTEQRRIYEDLRKYSLVRIQTGEINAFNAGIVMSKLLQVSGGWVYGSGRKVYRLDGEARLAALEDIVLGASGKVIVYVSFLHILDGVYEFLQKRGFEPHIITGKTPPTERTQIFNTFQNTDHRGPLVAFPKCISHGVTLTAADTVVWFGPTLSAETYDQANARIRRVGQRRKQLFVHLSSTPIERKVYNLLTTRLLQQDSFLHLLEDNSPWDN